MRRVRNLVTTLAGALLGEIGYEAGEIQRLRAERVV